MSLSYWKSGLLAVVLLLGGCDCKGRVQSLVYEEVDRTTTPSEQQAAAAENREVEPNDSSGSATPIILHRDLGAVFGEVETSSDVDWFAMEVGGDEDWIAELTVTPEDSSLDVSLYLQIPGEGNEPPLLYDLNGAGEEESVPMVRIPSDGIQRFFITGANDTSGSYRINIRRRLSAGAVEVEPSDHPHLATNLEIPGEIQGFYDRPHDRDIFFVPAESLTDAVYSLELSHIDGVEQTLEIYGDDSLESVLMSISVSERRPAVIPNLSLAAGAENGLYFVLSAGENYNRERGYRLRIIEHPAVRNAIVEREPNDTASVAHVVDLGDIVRGYLHTPNDVDRFRFVIEPPEAEEVDEEDHEIGADEELLAEYTGESLEEEEELEAERIDPWESVAEKEVPEHVVQVELRPLGDAHRFAMRWLPDVEGSEQSRDLHAESEEEGLTLCNHVLGPGEYDVEVRALETIEGFRPRVFDYEIQFRNLAQEVGLEIEPNNTFGEADRLPMGTTRQGYISYEGDVDVYAFIVGPDEVVIVDGEEEEGGEDVQGSEDRESDQDKPETEDEGDDDGVVLAGPATAWEPPPAENVTVKLTGNRLNLGLEILDDDGGRVALVNRAGPGGDEELNIDLPHGLYYVAVQASAGALCDAYQISVETP